MRARSPHLTSSLTLHLTCNIISVCDRIDLEGEEKQMSKRTNTKAHIACHILKSSGPLTRIELMMRVHVLEGNPGAFKRFVCIEC